MGLRGVDIGGVYFAGFFGRNAGPVTDFGFFREHLLFLGNIGHAFCTNTLSDRWDCGVVPGSGGFFLLVKCPGQSWTYAARDTRIVCFLAVGLESNG